LYVLYGRLHHELSRINGAKRPHGKKPVAAIVDAASVASRTPARRVR
jgi:hypothetical protein